MMNNQMTPKELNETGDQYFYGQGIDKNIEVAFTYYKRAADQNNPVGLANVGKYFLAKMNESQAFTYYEKSALMGYPLAFVKLSDMYLNGIGVKKNKKKAFKMMEEAANLNETDAYHLLGQYYLLGIGTSKNEKKALELFERSATSGNIEGMYHLGYLLLNGKSVKNDAETAFFYLDKAAVNKSLNAIKYLKTLYQTPHVYLKKKSDLYCQEMLFYYDEILAQLDDVEALKRVANVYYNGNDFTKINFEKSIKYFKVLYSLDEADGYLGMGLSYMYGQGVVIDFERAKDYLEIAANRGSSKAMNALGDMYRLGKGVVVDFQRARDFYLEAAKSNEVESLINLGLLHYRKQIKNANDGLALQFMTKASELGNGASFYWLGVFQEKGIGVNPNKELAKKNLLKAIENGNTGAKYKLAQIIYDETTASKISKKKLDKNFLEVKQLLIDYINSPLAQEVNVLYAMQMLGDMHAYDGFSEASKKVMRYWYELAAEKGFSKASVRMYDILKDTEERRAMYWLNKACEKPSDGEELFKMSIVYEEGLHGIMANKIRSVELLKKSAELQFQPAVMRLTMRK